MESVGQDTRHDPLASTEQRLRTLLHKYAYSPHPTPHAQLSPIANDTATVCTVSGLQNLHFQLPIPEDLLLPPRTSKSLAAVNQCQFSPHSWRHRNLSQTQKPSASAGCFCTPLHLPCAQAAHLKFLTIKFKFST